MNNEIVFADRKKILNAVYSDLKQCKTLEQALNHLVENFQTYHSAPIHVPEIKRKQNLRFRKTSPYLAFCADFRNSKRAPDGTLKENVLEITKQAGALWKKISETERAKWSKKAEEMSAKALATWEAKQRSQEISEKNTELPTYDMVQSAKKNAIVKMMKKHNILVPDETPLKVMRDKLNAIATGVPDQTVTKKTPAKKASTAVKLEAPKDKNYVSKLKKTELLSMIKTFKIQVELSKTPKVSELQNVLINHFKL